MTSMTAKTRFVVEPTSRESIRICFSYQDTDGTWFTSEVVRSYTNRPMVQPPESKSDLFISEEDKQQVPIMKVNQNTKLVKLEAPEKNRL